MKVLNFFYIKYLGVFNNLFYLNLNFYLEFLYVLYNIMFDMFLHVVYDNVSCDKVNKETVYYFTFHLISHLFLLYILDILVIVLN